MWFNDAFIKLLNKRTWMFRCQCQDFRMITWIKYYSCNWAKAADLLILSAC